MVLPLYLAMTGAEMLSSVRPPENCAWMASHFSPYNEGITNLPGSLPGGAMLILNDRTPCAGHSTALVAQQICDAAAQLECESVLLDFQRPPDSESQAIVNALVEALPCPVAVSEAYAKHLTCPVFAAPSPLHIPLKEHLRPWQGREIWLEAALCQENAAVTKDGTVFAPQFPPEGLDGGFEDLSLCCNYHMSVSEKMVTFTLFDTPDTLKKKLEMAHSLGVTRAIGLYQELGNIRF